MPIDINLIWRNIMINHKNERLAEVASVSVDNAREFMQTSLESIEKVAKLQLDSSKKMLEETSQAIKEISSAANPKDFFTRLGQLATSSVESNISNCRGLYEIMNEVQTNVSKLIENNIQTTQQNIVTAVEGLSKYNPTGSKASDSVKSWINGTNQAISTMQKMASQVAEYTNKNLKAATDLTVATAKKAASKK